MAKCCHDGTYQASPEHPLPQDCQANTSTQCKRTFHLNVAQRFVNNLAILSGHTKRYIGNSLRLIKATLTLLFQKEISRFLNNILLQFYNFSPISFSLNPISEVLSR